MVTFSDEAMMRHYLGGQPVLSKIIAGTPTYQEEYKRAMEWARYMFNEKTLHDYACEKFGDDFRKFPSWRFLVIGRQAWILSGGGKLSDETMAWIAGQLEVVKISKIEEVVEQEIEFEDDSLSFRETNERMFNNTFPLLDAYATIGFNNNFPNKKEKLDKEEIKKALARVNKTRVLKMLREYYQERLDAIQTDYFDDARMQKELPVVREILSQLNLLLKFTQAERNNGIAQADPKKIEKALEKKAAANPVKVEQIDLTSVKCKMKDPFTGVSGRNPSEVIGAKAVAIYNSQKRRVGILYAQEGTKLTIKGTTIYNFDEKKSTGKTCRDPIKAMATLQTADRLERFEIVIKDNIAGNPKEMIGRLSDDTVILRVWK